MSSQLNNQGGMTPLPDQYNSYKSYSSSQNQHHRHHHRHTSPVLIAVLCVAIFAFVTAGSAFAFVSLIEQGRANLLDVGEVKIETVNDAKTVDEGKTVEYKGAKYKLNENMVSVCLIGNDNQWNRALEGLNGQADVIVVVALDTETGKTSGIVIPRDSMVDIDINYVNTHELYQTGFMQICLAYAYGADDAQSSELVCRAVSRILYNIPVNYYYTINMDGVVELADLVGGVALEPIQSIPGTDIVEGELIKLEGDDAARYLRYRDDYRYGTALERQERQMQFLTALASKVLTIVKGNPSALLDIFNTLSGYSTTNLGASEVSFIASCIAKGSGDTVDFISLKGEPVHNDDSEWEQFFLDKDFVYETVLNVYYEKVGTVEDAEAPSSASAAADSSESASADSSESAAAATTSETSAAA